MKPDFLKTFLLLAVSCAPFAAKASNATIAQQVRAACWYYQSETHHGEIDSITAADMIASCFKENTVRFKDPELAKYDRICKKVGWDGDLETPDKFFRHKAYAQCMMSLIDETDGR